MIFKLTSKFKPRGDQPQAIEKLAKNLKSGAKHQVLLGVTGSGKTFTMAKVLEKYQKPVLVISHNKTLCAQLYQEFKEFFPKSAVHYFVSYYDYYQPEAYIPQSDTYIEKDAKINEQIDRLRHAAVQDLISRKDVIICASVSCIYNIGSPEDYQNVALTIKTGQNISRKDFIRCLIGLQYQRNDIDFKPGTFRVRGNLVDVFLVTGEKILKVEFEGDAIDKISLTENRPSPASGIPSPEFTLFPAHFWVAPQSKLEIAIKNIGLELQEQLKALKKQRKLLEAQRLEQKTNYDLEMLKETGYCHGVENYSRHLEFRKPGQAPFTLVDYFQYFNAQGFLIFIDESHMTIPQIRAMAVQDRARKKVLIDYGFRLPSALDNRPLTFSEFEARAKQTIYVSATPADYEKKRAGKENIIEQVIRPTGLLEPSIEIRPTKNQLPDLVAEIKKGTAKNHPVVERSSLRGSPVQSSAFVPGQRALVLTLTKRLAEGVSEYLEDKGIKNQWLHAEVKTLERPDILRNLRLGKFDVLVGVNLLREGLDLPEVSLVAVLDADKEGFLRNETTLIQIMGRAARHKQGHIILYADKTTLSMQKAIQEIQRRRKIQEQYNKVHKITPKAVVKEIREWIFSKKEVKDSPEFWLVQDRKILGKEMKEAAKNWDFERAAQLRDLIKKLK